MTLICLVRHGETEWNALKKIQGRADIPLNNVGALQANACRSYLSEFKWDVIVSSPLKRAKQTAEIINDALSLKLHVMDDFIERNYGEIEGLTLEERAVMYPDFQCPSQETLEEVKKRVMKGINELQRLHPNKKVIVVAHGGVINIILSVLSNGRIGTGKTGLSNGCLSHIHYHDGVWSVKNYNQISHLTTAVR
ncbi:MULTISPECIES: histidine phosphatase family protein [Lysinibacillus]|uniref:Histidine phosphatase family protein n=1 Tax=Lysinibacillus antri TaxID=2498145 RepID=A0A432LI63_9BACI|nr:MULTISPECIES: histidine phosphatase family protein [Lysinibacillus]RUL56991.1 histidine phosphatase family protein [Lysinibacillus antri]TSI03375.1 histidine phosphatase family protein [Lysinibacillus sp. BW-2-10]